MKFVNPLKAALVLLLISHFTASTAAPLPLSTSQTAPVAFQPARISVQPARFALQPALIPIDDPELVNPGRGFYKWRGVENVPAPEPAYDEYDRFYWHDPENPENSLETAPGNYNFAVIDQAISAAASRGHKFAFRVRAMANKRSGERFIPDYLAECGWTYRDTFIPDWNAPCFLDNAGKLMQALGARYNGDPRIAWVEIGLYGEWGEWALSDSTYESAPEDISIASDETLARIIDMQVDTFPSVRKVMLTKTRSAAVLHALGKSDQIGWRVDCFGRDGYFDFASNSKHEPAWDLMKDRWKTAPVIVEFCTDKVSLSSSIPLKQVQEFHISLIGNGNFTRWDRLSDRKQENLILLGKSAGYRYQIREVDVPAVWVPGRTLRVITNWENVGVAPYYEPAEVLFSLYDPRRSRTVWEARSTVDLQALLPTGDSPLSVRDELGFYARIPTGVYQLRIMVADPAGYRKPLKLAIAGIQDDGSYLLGNVQVSSTTKRR